MSTKIEVSINFKDETPETFGTANVLKQALLEFYGGEGTIHISHIDHNGDKAVYFELSSGRHKNAIWQMDILVTYVKEHFKVNDMYCDVWTRSTDESVAFNSDEVYEFESNN